MSAPLQRLAIRARPRSTAVAALCPALRPMRRQAAPPFTLTHFFRLASTTSPAPSPGDLPSPPGRQQYKTKKVWPPDFTRLSPQEQLRFEKRFKRRVALASARPRWVKFIKLVQLFSVTFVVIYCVLFMEWEYGPQPFAGVRMWFWDMLGALKGGQRSAVRPAGEGDQGKAAATATRPGAER